MKKVELSDAACIVAAAVLLYMSILSAVHTDRAGYQLVTGILSAALCLAPMVFHQLGIMRLPWAFIALMLVAIFLHGYGVLLMKYDDLVWYDTVTHTTSTIVVGLCVFYALMVVESMDIKTSFGSRLPMVLTMIMLTFSIYWEVLELVVDTIWGTNMQYSPWDTIRDMICNTAGSAWVIAFSTWFLRRRTGEEFINGLKLHPAIGRFITRSRSPLPLAMSNEASEAQVAVLEGKRE